MAKRMPRRDSKGRFVKRASGASRKRRAAPKRKRSYRRNPVAAANPRRRRRSYSAPKRARVRRRRSYRRNPVSLKSIFSKPTLKSVGFAVVGLAGTPMLTGFINRFLPASIVGNRWGGYAVKAGSAYALSLLSGTVAGKEAQRAVLVGGLAFVTVGIIQDFFPTLIGGVPSAGAGRYLSAAGKQPLLAGGMGEYIAPSRMGNSITASTASRLDPGNRF